MTELNVLLEDGASAKLSTCGACEKAMSSVNWCVQCSLNLCDSCLKIHKLFPITKSHTITETPVNPTSGGYKFCQSHPNFEEDYFCRDCTKPLCSKCVLKDHKQHETIEIGDEVEEVKKRLDERQTQAKRLLEEERQENNHISRTFREFTEHERNVKRVLKDLKSTAIKQIEQDYQKVEKGNERIVKTYTNQLKNDKTSSDQRMKQLQSTHDRIRSLKENEAKLSKSDFVGVIIPTIEEHVLPPSRTRPKLAEKVDNSDQNMVLFGFKTGYLGVGVVHYSNTFYLSDLPCTVYVERREGETGYIYIGVCGDKDEQLKNSWSAEATAILAILHLKDVRKAKTYEHSWKIRKDDNRFDVIQAPTQQLLIEGYLGDRGIQVRAYIRLTSSSGL